MRIAIQAESLVGGLSSHHAGISRYSVMIIDHLLRIGDDHEWHLLVNPAFDIPEHWTRLPNFRFRKIGPKFRIWRAIFRTPYLLRHGIDVLFSITGPMCTHRLVKQAYTVHDLFPFDHPEVFPDDRIGLIQWLAEHQLRHADLLFAVSHDTKNRVLERYPNRRPEDIIVTPNGPGNILPRVDRSEVDATKLGEIGVPFERYFFTLGTLEPRKNLERLFEAMALVRSRPEYADVGLCVGGGKGWKESPLFKKVEDMRLQDAVCFLGYVPDEHLPYLFARSEAAICASIDEGFGIPVLEAMLYGAPVLSSDRGALTEVGGDAALYFDPFDVKSMADHMISVLKGERDRQKWIEDGLAQAAKFSWEETAKVTLEGLIGLGAKPSKRPD